MAKLFDLVKVNVPTAGVGDVTFGSPFSPGFFLPAEVGAVDGDRPRYVIVDGDDVELGVGLIKSSVTQMERTVLRSRIGGVAGSSKLNLGGTAFLAFTAAAEDIVSTDYLAAFAAGDLRWCAIPVGGYYYVDTSIPGVSVPPTTHSSLVFIELTAGKTGVGQYNEGKLVSESVSGSAPLIAAYGTISVSGSPINGKTIHLINTEETILRPRATEVGSVQQDQMQRITGSVNVTPGDAWGASGAFSSAAGGSRGTGSVAATGLLSFDSGNSPGARVGAETRMKNLGVTAYMRVK